MTRPPHAKRPSAALLASLVLLLAPLACDRNHEPGNIGRPAPEFVISDGVQSLDLAKLRGKVVILNLWASWCAPCVEELPSLLALEHQMPGLAIVGISTDQDDEVYRHFLTLHHVDLRTVRDSDGRINALYGTAMIPETYIIDGHGILRRKFIGPQDWTSPEIVRYLQRLENS